jgi:hypothetical protein
MSSSPRIRIPQPLSCSAVTEYKPRESRGKDRNGFTGRLPFPRLFPFPTLTTPTGYPKWVSVNRSSPRNQPKRGQVESRNGQARIIRFWAGQSAANPHHWIKHLRRAQEQGSWASVSVQAAGVQSGTEVNAQPVRVRYRTKTRGPLRGTLVKGRTRCTGISE